MTFGERDMDYDREPQRGALLLHGDFALNDTVLVAGGDTISGERASAELYDPETDIWTPTGSLNVA